MHKKWNLKYSQLNSLHTITIRQVEGGRGGRGEWASVHKSSRSSGSREIWLQIAATSLGKLTSSNRVWDRFHGSRRRNFTCAQMLAIYGPSLFKLVPHVDKITWMRRSSSPPPIKSSLCITEKSKWLTFYGQSPIADIIFTALPTPFPPQ